MSRPQAVMVTGHHPSANPRLLKGAGHLTRSGWRVEVWYPELDRRRTPEDRELACAGGWVRRCYWSVRGLSGLSGRLRRRLAMNAVKLGWPMAGSLGYGMHRLRRRLRRLGGLDLLVGHQEVGLWAASRCPPGPRIWVDLEDWYSEDLPAGSRPGRPIALLKRLERWALTSADLCTTTSQAMAAALVDAYVSEPPQVIRNVFSRREHQQQRRVPLDRQPDEPVSFHWFSQTLGPDRGLETLFQAARRLQGDFLIHLRGRVADRRWLEQVLPAEIRPRVRLHACVPNAELIARIGQHDVGMALEIPYCKNKQLTISNKLFAYLVAGKPVIATDTLGHREILGRHPQLGCLVAPGDVDALARQMTRALRVPAATLALDQRARATVDQHYCWEAIEPQVAHMLQPLQP